MALKWPAKDPDELLDYKVDWAKRLGTDSIASSSWPNPPANISILTDSHQAKATVIWISGGTAGQTYTFTNRITTTSGRIMDQSIDLPVKAR